MLKVLKSTWLNWFIKNQGSVYYILGQVLKSDVISVQSVTGVIKWGNFIRKQDRFALFQSVGRGVKVGKVIY